MQPAPRRVTPGTPAQRPRTAPAAAKRGAGAAASFCLLPGLLPTAGAARPCRSSSMYGKFVWYDTCCACGMQALKDVHGSAARALPAAGPLHPAPRSRRRALSSWRSRVTHHRSAQLRRTALRSSWSRWTQRVRTQPLRRAVPSAWPSQTMRRMRERLRGTAQRSRVWGRRSAQPTAWRSPMMSPAWARLTAARRPRQPASFPQQQSPGAPLLCRSAPQGHPCSQYHVQMRMLSRSLIP